MKEVGISNWCSLVLSYNVSVQYCQGPCIGLEGGGHTKVEGGVPVSGMHPLYKKYCFLKK